jgi:histidine triad (HIT) family protein
MSDDCIFCSIVSGSAPARGVDENGGAVAFLDVNPASPGHTLVIPRTHVRDIWDLGSEDSAAVWELTRMVANRVRRSFEPDGLTLLQSNGEAAWQHVFHLHVHVVPRWRNDGLQRPWPIIPGDPAELDLALARLKGG